MSRGFWNNLSEFIIISAYIIGFLCVPAILGWQIFYWLRTGVWTPLRIHEAFIHFGIDLTHIYAPANWHGLAKIAQWLLDLPLVIGAPVILISAAHAWQAFVSNLNSHV